MIPRISIDEGNKDDNKSALTSHIIDHAYVGFEDEQET